MSHYADKAVAQFAAQIEARETAKHHANELTRLMDLMGGLSDEERHQRYAQSRNGLCSFTALVNLTRFIACELPDGHEGDHEASLGSPLFR